jgi:hypothetical protein
MPSKYKYHQRQQYFRHSGWCSGCHGTRIKNTLAGCSWDFAQFGK